MTNPADAAGFEPVLAVASLLAGLTVPYWISGGWAIDLAAGAVTREHDDVDIQVLERDEHALRADLRGVEFALRHGDGPPGPWLAGQRLIAGPDRVVLSSPILPAPTEVVLGAAIGGTWVYHRGTGQLRRPLAAATRHWRGVPYLAPEVILLGKCLAGRPKDQHDFDVAWPLLDAEQRAWLADAIERRDRAARRRAAHGPAPHPWAVVLASN